MTTPARIAFVRPPNLQKSGGWKKQGVIRCPLNLAMLAAYVRAHGPYDCTIVDFEVTPATSIETMTDAILAVRPDYVCFTTLSPRFPTVVRLCRALKDRAPGVTCIVGGPHVTGQPAIALDPAIPYGNVGEGEEALVELLHTLESGGDPKGIRNLAFHVEGAVRVNEARPFIADLDALPLPAWDLMQIEEYVDPAYFDGPHLALFTSRGCPHDCAFCASKVTWRRRVRFRSVESVLHELRTIVHNLGIHNVMFWDDNFAARKDRALAICRGMIDEDLQLQYTVQIRADQVTPELAGALRDSGCRFAAIGVESGNDAILEAIGKGETKEDMRRAIAVMNEAGLPSIASYILGLPGDTHETIRETIEFAFSLGADQSKFMILAPYPGTALYAMAVERGLVSPGDFDQLEALNYYDSVAINLSHVGDGDLIAYQDEAYDRFDALQEEKREDEA